jgi:hypothetical protein
VGRAACGARRPPAPARRPSPRTPGASAHLGRLRADTRVVLLNTRAAVDSSASDSHTGTTLSPNISWPMQKSPDTVGRLKRACIATCT